MDLDFLLITLSYFAVIMFIHYTLRKQPVENNDLVKSLKTQTKPVKNESSQGIFDESILKEYTLTEPELIIDEDDINKIKNHKQNDEFLKYLNIEDKEKLDNFKKLGGSLVENMTGFENTKDYNISDFSSNITYLDKYFDNKPTDKYTFDPVPTLTKKYEETKLENVKQQSELLNDNLLNPKKVSHDSVVYDNVCAFDEFDQSQFGTCYATL